MYFEGLEDEHYDVSVLVNLFALQCPSCFGYSPLTTAIRGISDYLQVPQLEENRSARPDSICLLSRRSSGVPDRLTHPEFPQGSVRLLQALSAPAIINQGHWCTITARSANC
jgi:hypothetical protein